MARHFQKQGWIAVIFGGPDDAVRAGSMQQRIGNSCIALAGKPSLYENGCLLGGFSLALGNDTGLSHLARACGVRTGFLYGPTTRHFGFYPYGDPPFLVFETPLFCRPCHAHGGNVCLRLTHRCLRRIGPDTVIKGLEELAAGGAAGEAALQAD